MGAAKVSTLSSKHAICAETFFQVRPLARASPTPLVTCLCVHYNVVLSFATRILLDRFTSIRVTCTWSCRDHMTDASLRGNQLVSSWFRVVSQVLVTVWFPIWFSSPTTLFRVRASQHVESNQLRPLVGLYQVSNVRDNNLFNIINIRPTVIAINKIHIQPIFFSFRCVFRFSVSGYVRNWSNACGNATGLTLPQIPYSPSAAVCFNSNTTDYRLQVHLEYRQMMGRAPRDT